MIVTEGIQKFISVQCLHNLKEAILLISQVNGVDLAEIQDGEIAITNLHSCNGPEFVLQLQFYCKQDNMSKCKSPSKRPTFFINFFLKIKI